MDPFLDQRFETIGDHVILPLSGVAVIKLSNLTGDCSLNTKLCVENGVFGFLNSFNKFLYSGTCKKMKCKRDFFGLIWLRFQQLI